MKGTVTVAGARVTFRAAVAQKGEEKTMNALIARLAFALVSGALSAASPFCADDCVTCLTAHVLADMIQPGVDVQR